MHAPHHNPEQAFQRHLADEAATLAFGRQLASVIVPGMTIFLEGDLGAGKTTLTRGVLRGLGFMDSVKSPTYTLVEPYVVSNLYFHHFDLYRFADASEWEEAGFREMFNAESVCLVEWPDKAAALLPEPDWRIRLEPCAAGRQLTLTASTQMGTICLSRLIATITMPPAA